jgi:hypothetical protein
MDTMIELKEMFSAVSEALGLIRQAAELAQKARPENRDNETVPAVLSRLRADAISTARASESRLWAILHEFQSMGVDLDRSIDQMLADLHWYNWLTSSRLKELRSSFQQTHHRLTTSVGNVTALLLCSNSISSSQEAFQAASASKKELDAAMRNFDQSTVRNLLELLMMKTALDITARLEG